MSFPGADAFGGGVGGVGSPHGDGGAQVGVFEADIGDHACAGGIHGETERGVGAFDVSGGGDDARRVGELGRHLEKNDSTGIVSVGGGGHHTEEVAIRGEGGAAGGEAVRWPGTVFGVPGEHGRADGLGDIGDFSFFGGFEGAVDGGDREAGEEADDGNDDEDFDESESGPAPGTGDF